MAQDAACIRHKKNYFELTALKNGVHFTTVELKALSEEYLQLEKKYNSHQSGLVKQVIEVVGTFSLDIILIVVVTYCPMFDLLNGILAHLDVICR